MGAANVDPAPVTVPLTLPVEDVLELLVLLLLLLPQAAAPTASTPAAARASRLRDLTEISFVVGRMFGGTLSRHPPQSVIELWRRCENRVKARPRSGIRSRHGCG